MNVLTRAGVLVEDKLFATLDPTVRRVRLPQGQTVLLADTVGFIHKLPHQLVEAFKATLEELAEADVLVHVVDASHPGLDDQVAAVESLLAELELTERPTIAALNKVDRLDGDIAREALRERFNGVAISALSGEGIEPLLARIDEALRPRVTRVTLFIPYRDGPALSLCYEKGRVRSRRDDPEGIRVDVELPRRLISQLGAYRLAD